MLIIELMLTCSALSLFTPNLVMRSDHAAHVISRSSGLQMMATAGAASNASEPVCDASLLSNA
jgi:hypothetical protein